MDLDFHANFAIICITDRDILGHAIVVLLGAQQKKQLGKAKIFESNKTNCIDYSVIYRY